MSFGRKTIAMILMMLFTCSALLPGNGLAEQGPDCLQHEWTEEIKSRTYSVCPSTPGRHYLSEATVCLMCRYCHAEQPGTERKVSYTEENSPEVSGHLYDESGICAFPGCGVRFSDVRRSQRVPMQRIEQWDGKLTFFETASQTALEHGEDGVYQTAKAVYQKVDLGSLLINAALSDMTDDSEQAQQDRLMEDLIRENFMSYLSYAVKDESDTEQAIGSLDTAFDRLEAVQLEVPASGKLISVESLSKGRIQGDALKMFQVWIGGASILCESEADVKAVYLMQCTHDFAISYLSHLQQSAHPDSSLYRACDKMIREVNLKWPLGEGVPDELKQASSTEIAKMISAAGLDKLISLTYENNSILIRALEELNFPQTSQFMSSAAGVLIAFKAGAVLGHLITPYTGRTLQEEEELLRLYIASAEIKSALDAASEEAKYDLASLYLTAEEAGSKKAYDYYLDADRADVLKQLLNPFFPPEAEESTKKTLELIQRQLDELNTIRDEMGLPKGQDILELLDFLPRSDPSSLYGTWDFDWHNERAYEDQADIFLGVIAADILGGHLQITVDEHALRTAYFERDGSLSTQTAFQPETFPVNITDSVIDDGSGKVIQWRLSPDEQTLYLYQGATDEDQVFRFFRVGGTSDGNADSTRVPSELRGNWVVAEAEEQNADNTSTDLLRDPSGGMQLDGDLSFTDDSMHLETGTTLNYREILGGKVTGTAGALVSEDGRELHWQFNEDRTAVAIADDFGLRIRAFRPTGKQESVQLPDYPAVPEYRNPDLMGEWVLVDANGNRRENFALAESLMDGHGYSETLVLRPGTMDLLRPDSSGNTSSPCRYTRAFLEADGVRYPYQLDGDRLAVWRSEDDCSRYARKNTQAEKEGAEELQRIAEEGFYDFRRSRQGEASVEGYHGYAGILQIPETTEDGYLVTSLDEGALQGAKRLFKLILHEGIKQVDYQKIPTLKAIEVDGDNAAYKSVDGVLFSRDGTVLKMYPAAAGRTAYEIPEGVTTIAHDAFNGAANLEEIIFPSTLRIIGKNAFAGCTALRQARLPENMDEILDKAFENCTQLEEVWIPQTAGTVWMPSAFDGCTSLRAVHTAANTNVDTVLKNAGLPVVSDLTAYRIETDAEGNVHVTSDGILPQVSLGDERWAQLVSPGKSIILEGTYSGGQWSLALSETDVSLTLADALRSKDYTAGDTPWAGYLSQIKTVWYESENIRWTLDGEGLLRIAGEGKMPRYIRYSENDDGTFSMNQPWPKEKVRAVEMDPRLTSVSRRAFARHTALERIVLPENLQEIEDSAFAECSALAEVVIPDTAVSIREHAFENCTALKSIVLPDSVTRLDAYAFSNCRALEALTLGSGVQEIRHDTFSGCRMLRRAVIPSTVRKIEARAFDGCAGLMHVYIPEEVSGIAPNAFSQCPAIQAVHCVRGSQAEEWASLAGYPVSYEMDPEKEESGPIASGETGSIQWILSADSELSVTGTGSMPDFQRELAPWYPYVIRKAEVGGGITRIGTYAFYGLRELETVSLPAGLLEIGEHAFENCPSLKAAACVRGTYAEQWALAQGMEIEYKAGPTPTPVPATPTPKPAALPTPDSGKAEGSYIENENDFAVGRMQDGTAYISGYTGTDAYVKIPASIGGAEIQAVGSAFSGKTDLKGVIIPEGVKTILPEAFKGCTALADITLPQSLERISDSAFAGCTALRSVFIPQGVRLSSFVFAGCTALETIEMQGPSATWADIDREYYYTIQSNFIDGCTSLKEILTPEDFLEFRDGMWMSNDKYGKTIIGYTGREAGETLIIPDDAERIDICQDVVASTVREVIFPDKAFIVVGTFTGKSVETIHLGAQTYLERLGTLPKLRSITVSPENEYVRVEDGVLFSQRILVKYPAGLEARDAYRVPEGVYEIGPDSFAYTSVREIVLSPTTVKVADAFSNSALETITIPPSVTSIDEGCLDKDAVPNLKLVRVEQNSYAEKYCIEHGLPVEYVEFEAEGEENLDYVSNPDDFSGYEIKDRFLLQAYTGNDRWVRIPESINGQKISEISNGVFKDNVTLEKIIIPEGITLIGSEAFANCTFLKEVVLPSTLKEISTRAFENCRSLKSIVLPRYVDFGTKVFSGCDSLETIVFERYDPVYSENQSNPLRGCTSLREVTDGDGMLHYKNGVLYSREQDGTIRLLGCTCTEPREKVVIPEDTVYMANSFLDETVKEVVIPDAARFNLAELNTAMNLEKLYIGTNAYIESDFHMSEFPNLKSIEVSGKNQTLFTQDGVLFQKQGSRGRLLCFPAKMENPPAAYLIPSGTRVVDASFSNTPMKEILFPDTVREIYGYFRNSAVEYLTIPASVTYICSELYCPNLKCVYVEKDSYAEEFCQKYGYPYKYIEQETVFPTVMP